MNIVPRGTHHRNRPKGTDTIAASTKLKSRFSLLRKRYVLISTAILGLAAMTAVSAAFGSNPPALSSHQASIGSVKPATEAAPPVSPAPEAAAADTGGSSSASVTTNNGHTSVTVNGQNVPVPENGSIQQAIPGDGGNVHVSINSQNTGTARNQQSSSTNVQIFSSSSSSTEGGSAQ